jgi:hypothetical protein
MMTSLSKPRPMQQFRVGSVSASIWKREHEGKIYYSASIDRSYKDGEQWKRSSSFNKDELQTVIDLAIRCQGYIELAFAKREEQAEA